MRTANLQTLKWKPSPKMCWLKSSVFNSVRSAERSPFHELKLNEQPLNIYETPCCQDVAGKPRMKAILGATLFQGRVLPV
jgi:hypothetical protein